MRKKVALSALALTGMTFLGAAFVGLPQDPAGISLGLKVTLIASGVGFLLAVVVYVFAAWPERHQKN